MEASSAKSAGYLSPSRLTVGELAGCVAALAFAFSLFLPWYGTSATNHHSMLAGASGGETVSAWDTFPILRWILLAGAIAPFVLVWIVARGHKLEWRPGEITMIVGVTAFVLVLCEGVILGKPGDTVEISLQYGYPIALVTAAAMAASGFVRQSRYAKGRKPPGTV